MTHVGELGGFTLSPPVSKDTSQEAFEKMWSQKIGDTLKNIRNSLVHARESRTQEVIYPTVGNDRLLRPWLPVVRAVAEQVTMFD